MTYAKTYDHAAIPNSAQVVDISVTDHECPLSTIGIWVGGAGDIYVDMWGEGTNVPFIGALQGSYVVGNFKTIRKTNTTATNMTLEFRRTTKPD